MRIFDYSFLKNKIPNQILNLAAIIYDLRAKEEYRKKDNPLVLANLMNIAIIESIKGSNAIEGIVTTDKRIEDIAHGDITPLTHSEQEITGYRDVLNNIHNNHNELNIDIDLILYFHKSLFSYSINNNIGSFKKENNYIMEIDKDGRRKIRFTPTKASEVEDAMLQWIYA